MILCFSESLNQVLSDSMFISNISVGPKFGISPTYSPRFFVENYPKMIFDFNTSSERAHF